MRVLTEMYRFRLFSDDTNGRSTPTTWPRRRRLHRDEVAEEGTVLLKDAAHTLPLSDDGGPIAVVGPAAQAGAGHGRRRERRGDAPR